jgi:hypothetical protein
VEGTRVGYRSFLILTLSQEREKTASPGRVRARVKSLFRIFTRQQLVQLVAAHVTKS